jgi:hypothetical protein
VNFSEIQIQKFYEVDTFHDDLIKISFLVILPKVGASTIFNFIRRQALSAEMFFAIRLDSRFSAGSYGYLGLGRFLHSYRYLILISLHLRALAPPASKKEEEEELPQWITPPRAHL